MATKTPRDGGKSNPNSTLVLLLAGVGVALLVVAISASPTSIPGQSGATIPATSVLSGRILLGLLGLICLSLAVVFGFGLAPALAKLWDDRQTALTAVESGVLGVPVTIPTGRLPVEVRGREALLRRLRRQAQRSRGMVVLTGMGGIGKSTIATVLSQQLMTGGLGRRRRSVWWVSAADATSLTSGLVAVARQLGATEPDLKAISSQAVDGPDRFWVWLEHARPGWLLVVDNADDPHLLAAPAGPTIVDKDAAKPVTGKASVADGNGWIRISARGLVLVTSRHVDAATWGRQASVHEVGPLNETDSARVLCDLAPEAGGPSEAERLGRRLGGLPLALHLAGSYLGSGIAQWPTFAAYYQALDREPTAIRALSPDPDTERAGDERAIVLQTWEISLDTLAAHALPQGRPVLRLLSCYAPAVPIPHGLIMSDHVAALLLPTLDHEADSRESGRRLEQALRGLHRLDLIDNLPDQHAVTIHPVVADTNRVHLLTPSPKDPEPALVRQTAVTLLAAGIEALEPARPADWPSLRLLTSHLRAVFATAAPHLSDQYLTTLVDMTTRSVDASLSSGAMATAIELTGGALAYSGRLGDDHPAIIQARDQLTYETAHRGRLAEAEAAYREVLDLRKRVLGEDHPDTLATRASLAGVVGSQGRWTEAEAAYQEVLHLHRRVLGDDHPATLSIRDSLAEVMANQGHWTEAGTAHQEVLDLRRRVLGQDHPDTLSTRASLAGVMGHQRRETEAEAAYREVLDLRRQVLGEDHPDTLSTRASLAQVVAGQGRWTEAEAAYQEVLDLRRRVLGDDHPDTLSTRDSLAQAAADQGRWTEAETAYRDVLDLRRRVLGDDHPDTLSTRDSLARVVAGQGRWTEAETAYLEILDLCRRALGDDYSDTQAAHPLQDT